ncbi:MAG: protein-tyrosine-phosphatase [Cyclobacteriaceae bacterium]|nr:protein-tyrosine-phosphatase [Cyclobacteriaceae bacterium]
MTKILLPLHKLINQCEGQFSTLAESRKPILKQLAEFIQEKQKLNESIDLNFICTHNSRRSHIAQVWAQTAAAYYRIEKVRCFSGGTEATAFNPRAVKAMTEVGFIITKLDNSENPRYDIRFSETEMPLIAFSKKYDDASNPTQGFAAIMTCSHADENCPLVVGAAARISLPYDDPKDFDGTDQEGEKYHERVLEIGLEIAFAFSLVQVSDNLLL